MYTVIILKNGEREEQEIKRMTPAGLEKKYPDSQILVIGLLIYVVG